MADPLRRLVDRARPPARRRPEHRGAPRAPPAQGPGGPGARARRRRSSRSRRSSSTARPATPSPPSIRARSAPIRRRDRTRICVVEEPFNIQPLERTGEYHGLYHVLLGALSPQRGIGPDELAIDGLLARLDGVAEVVVATNPNVEGEATALYLARLLRPPRPRGHPARLRHAGRRRHRVHRRSDARPLARRPARDRMTASTRAAMLARGDLPPEIGSRRPGRRAARSRARLARAEAPGVNTLGAGDAPAIVWREALGANVARRRRQPLRRLHRRLRRRRDRPPPPRGGRRRRAPGRRSCCTAWATSPRTRRASSSPNGSARSRRSTTRASTSPSRAPTRSRSRSRPRCSPRRGRGLLVFDPGYHGITLGALAATSRAAFRAPVRRPAPARRRAPALRLPARAGRARARRGRRGARRRRPGRAGGRPRGRAAAAGRLARRRSPRRRAAPARCSSPTRSSPASAAPARSSRSTHDGVRPDLLCCGKALGGGLPIAAVVGRAELMAAWRRPGEALHTATFLAHPLACAAALATLDVLARERPGRARARASGARLRAAARARRPRRPASRCAAAARSGRSSSPTRRRARGARVAGSRRAACWCSPADPRGASSSSRRRSRSRRRRSRPALELLAERARARRGGERGAA